MVRDGSCEMTDGGRGSGAVAPRRWRPALAAIVSAGVLQGCGGGAGGAGAAQPAGAPWAAADVKLLLFGNSHTHGQDLPALVQALMQAAKPGLTVAAVAEASSMFLDQRLNHAPSVTLLQSQRWQAVVLQAQPYSSSGTVEYSTAEARDWVRRVRAQGALPLLFPEWPRRGVDESGRIFELHVSIARAEPACVPPIPQAFDLAARLHPGLVLHAADGNHASPAGALLAAMVIATTLSGRPPADHPTLSPSAVDSATQSRLREAAGMAVAATSPWAWCQADKPAGVP